PAVVRVPDLRPIQCTIPRRSLTIVAAVCAAAFAALAVYVWSSPHRTAIEGRIADAITSTKKDGTYRVFDAISVLGSRGAVVVGAVVLAIFAWWWWRNVAWQSCACSGLRWLESARSCSRRSSGGHGLLPQG